MLRAREGLGPCLPRTAQLGCTATSYVGLRGANLDNLPLSRQQIVHKLISSWISMVTMKDTSILTSAPTTAIFVLMTMLTNAHL